MMDRLDADEKNKIATLKREKGSSKDGVGWMYQGTKPDDEEYLLGRRIDKHVEGTDDTKEDEASAIFGERIKANIALDMAAKMREDPLYAIRRKEEESRKKLLENPIRMKELQRMIEQQQHEKEKLSKKKKKKKEKKKKSKKSRDEDSNSSEESDDDIMMKYLSIMTSKHGGHEKEKGKKRKRVEDRSESNDESDRKNGRKEVSRQHERQKDRSDGYPSGHDWNSSRNRGRDRDFGDRNREEKGKRDFGDRNREERGKRDFGDRNREERGSRDLEDDTNRWREHSHKGSRGKEYEREYEGKQFRKESRDGYRDYADERRRERPYDTNRRRHSYSPEKDDHQSRLWERERKTEGHGNFREREKQFGASNFRKHSDRDRSHDRETERRRENYRNRESSKQYSRNSEKEKSFHKSHQRQRKEETSDSEIEGARTSRGRMNDKPEGKKRQRSESSSSSSSASSSSQASDRSGRSKARKSAPEGRQYGLIKTGGNRQSPNVKRSSSSSSSSPSPSDRMRKSMLQRKPKSVKRQATPPRRSLTNEEKERRLQEMMDNAKWRDEQREGNVKRYKEEEKLEKEKNKKGGKGFLSSLMVEHASSSSVEDRLRRNKHNIQRTRVDLDKNFTKK